MSGYNKTKNLAGDRHKDVTESQKILSYLPKAVLIGYTKGVVAEPVALVFKDVAQISSGTFGLVFRAYIFSRPLNRREKQLVPKRPSTSNNSVVADVMEGDESPYDYINAYTPLEDIEASLAENKIKDVRGEANIVAVKKVFQDPKYKNRELQIIRTLDHPNVTTLRHYFKLMEEGRVFLCIVLDYIPTNIYQYYKYLHSRKAKVCSRVLARIMHQLFSALDYLHARSICHRDIKPPNLLFDEKSEVLKICDFGSAKLLVEKHQSISYICSRHYRAPELILGKNDYSCSIDIWSAGCVMGEIIVNRPLFPGLSNNDQLIRIITVLGYPTPHEIQDMNLAIKFPSIDIKSIGLHAIIPEEYVDCYLFLRDILVYSPLVRPSARQLLQHPFIAAPEKTTTSN